MCSASTRGTNMGIKAESRVIMALISTGLVGCFGGSDSSETQQHDQASRAAEVSAPSDSNGTKGIGEVGIGRKWNLADIEASTATDADKARMASLRVDLINMMTAQEEYFSTHDTYAANFDLLQAGAKVSVYQKNVVKVSGNKVGYTMSVSNPAIITGLFTKCTVQAGAGVATTIDGEMLCS